MLLLGTHPPPFFCSHPVAADGWASATKQVPFLKEWVYTSEAPADLVDAWQPLANGTGGPSTDGVVPPSTAGALADVSGGSMACSPPPPNPFTHSPTPRALTLGCLPRSRPCWVCLCRHHPKPKKALPRRCRP